MSEDRVAKAVEAINSTAIIKDISGDQMGTLGNTPFHAVVNPEEVARAVIAAIWDGPKP